MCSSVSTPSVLSTGVDSDTSCLEDSDSPLLYQRTDISSNTFPSETEDELGANSSSATDETTQRILGL